VRDVFKPVEQQGVIKQASSLLDANQIEFSLTVFVQVKAAKHDSQWLTKFANTAQILNKC